MKHFLSYVDESIKANWKSPALSNYGANTFTYGEVAAEIERMHLLFEKCGIKKGDKIADSADGLSLPQYASIDGVACVYDKKIIIEKVD